MLGYILALSAGLAFSVGDVLVRLASTELTPKLNLMLSLLIGTPLAVAVALIYRQEFPPANALYLYLIAGLLNFVLGRLLFYYSIAWAGAATSSVITSLATPLAAINAWLLLGEMPRLGEIIGLAAVASAVLIASKKPSGLSLHGGSAAKGILAGVGAALMFSLSAPAVRAANSLGGSPLWGMALSYIVAIPFAAVVAAPDLKRSLTGKGVASIGAGALFTATAQMFRYTALSLITVASVSIMVALFPIYTAFLTYLIFGKYSMEKPGLAHFMGAALAVIGVACTLVL